MKIVRSIGIFSCFCLIVAAPLLQVIGYSLKFQFLSLKNIGFLVVVMLLSIHFLKNETTDNVEIDDKK